MYVHGKEFGDAFCVQVTRPDPTYCLNTLAPQSRALRDPAVSKLKVGHTIAVRHKHLADGVWAQTLKKTQATPDDFDRYTIVQIVKCKRAPLVFVQPCEEPSNESTSPSTSPDPVPPSRFKRAHRTG